MSSVNVKWVSLLVITVVVLGSVIGVLMYGERAGDKGAQSQPQGTDEEQAREIARKIASYMQAFARSPPRTDYSPELLRLHELLNSEKPVAILFWPASCGSCVQYKQEVWDQVKALFDNVTFIDYNIDTGEGAALASAFEIPGITIVLGYNGTIFGVIYGEHIPPSQLAYLIRVLTEHAGGGVRP